MSFLSLAYTDRDGASRRVRVAFAPAAPEARGDCGGEFVFGSASHPADFRCQACHHFAWGGHRQAAAWHGAADAIARLALAAMGQANAGAACSPAMLETLRAWARDRTLLALPGGRHTVAAFTAGPGAPPRP